MLPFERLRALARYAGDDTGLVVEAADCLADFAVDPTQLVTVCRRLLAHHPSSGPLWWLCTQVLTATDPSGGARDAVRALERDRTAPRLSSLLPFPHDDPVAVLGWPDVTGEALAERPDLDVVVVRTDYRAPRAAGRRVRVADEVEAMAASPSHLLVEVLAAGPQTAIVPHGVTDLLDSLDGAELWLVIPVGRLLPARLFDVLQAQVTDDPDVETLDVTRAAQTAGPWGLDIPAHLGAHVNCPVAPELLRI
ncbi:MAG TPA: hypothetical protein VLV81_11200 [Acidimicrobiia bacterium]|nr:hypothetical protein [Acidimicrobiia bacterium]